MIDQTSFEEEEAAALLSQLQQFQEILNQDWARVLNQWGNLQVVWQDEQYERFEPLFERLAATYEQAERECEEYIAFIQQQIQVAEKRREELGKLP